VNYRLKNKKSRRLQYFYNEAIQSLMILEAST